LKQSVIRLKKLFFIIFLFLIGGKTNGQNLYLKVTGENGTETKIIDSIDYERTHKSQKSIAETINLMTDKLNKKGYLENKIIEKTKLNDSVFEHKYHLGKKTNYARIYIGVNFTTFVPEKYTLKNDSVTVPFDEIEFLLNSVVRQLESKGYAMAKTKLTSIEKKNRYITASLSVSKETLRNINNIVINGYPKFPEGHKKNILRLYKNKTFNQKSLEKIYTDFEKYRFVKQSKYPEILFTKDSTKIYVYLERAKSNSFDGYLGFTNNENDKLVVSGYLDLVLNNILNSGEKFALYWKSDGQDQKTFNFSLELPYLFKSPLGLKADLNIFKQDSTFQNTRTNLELGYYLNYNTRIYLGYQATESSDIQNVNSATINDFESSFLTTSLELSNFNNDDFLFPEKTNINFKLGTGSRNANSGNDNQFFARLIAKHNFYLNPKNIIHLRTENFYLKSKQYITNELYRFGGINSFRGFNENSLQANTLTSLLTEYRYLATPNLYIHSILDYGYFKDTASATNENLLSLGIGFGLLTKNGLFNIIYANGSTKNQESKLSNSIVHISFKANF
jgi:hypothetical protein